ncbi:MAG: hypothetical protein Q4P66_07145 [Actinomycetaceae bacterium]|nr:hypothetical protein [Actinomycetaceae bacterium]
MAIAMPSVRGCEVKECAFNRDGCAAFAMTMGQDGCATFIQLDTVGGLDKVTAQVGACQKADCVHNSNLECKADFVRISGANGECMMYEAR